MVAGNWGISTLRPEHQKCQRGKRRVIQRAIEEGNDETERDLGRNDGQRDLEKLYNALEENGISHENKYGWNPDKSDSFRFTEEINRYKK